MDLFTTLISLAGLSVPQDRVIDGRDLTDDLLSATEYQKAAFVTKSKVKAKRNVFYYRGGLLMAVRSGSYKLHLWTWTTPVNELQHVGRIFAHFSCHFITASSKVIAIK